MDCVAADEVLTGITSLFALCVYVTIVRELHNVNAMMLSFLFLVYAFNQLALTYLPDEVNGWPQGLSVLAPIVAALIVMAVLEFAKDATLFVVSALFVYMILHTFGTALSVVMAVLSAIVLWGVMYMCRATDSCRSLGNMMQVLFISMTTSFLIVMGALALLKFYDVAFDRSTGDPCPRTSNMLLLCDYKCASITSESDLKWMAAWLVATAVLTFVRVLAVACCGYRDTRECCSRRSRRAYEQMDDAALPATARASSNDRDVNVEIVPAGSARGARKTRNAQNQS